MKLDIVNPVDRTKDVFVTGMFEEDDPSIFAALDTHLVSEVQDARIRGIFQTTFGEHYSTKLPESGHRRVLVIGLGKKK